MKSIRALMVVILSFGFTQAQDSISALFIGNSYTYVNDLPNMVKLIAESRGDELTVDSKTNGGYTFQNQWNDPLTFQKMKSRNWDFVVFQGQSQEPAFPYQQVTNSTLPYAKRLADSVYQLLNCSQVNFFMTWGRENGDPQWDSINTFSKMNERLKLAYLRFRDETKSSVSPVAEVWRLMRELHPSINLYSGDGSHPSLEGSYLAACTFYVSLYRKPVSGASYHAGIDAQTALWIQNLADQVVLDDLSMWSLRPKSKRSLAFFDYTQNEEEVIFSNESWLATSYAWNFGEGTFANQENPTHTYIQTGDFSVQLIASSLCGSDTATRQITIEGDGLSVDELGNPELQVFYHEDNLLQIKGASITQGRLYGLDGKLISSWENRSKSESVFIQVPNSVTGKVFLYIEQKGMIKIRTLFLQ